LRVILVCLFAVGKANCDEPEAVSNVAKRGGGVLRKQTCGEGIDAPTDAEHKGAAGCGAGIVGEKPYATLRLCGLIEPICYPKPLGNLSLLIEIHRHRSDQGQTPSLVSLNEFGKPARFAILRLLLIKKFQLVFVEDLKEFVPADLLKRLFLFAEIDAKQASFTFGADDRGTAFSLLDPVTDRLVIGGPVRTAHVSLLWLQKMRECIYKSGWVFFQFR